MRSLCAREFRHKGLSSDQIVTAEVYRSETIERPGDHDIPITFVHRKSVEIIIIQAAECFGPLVIACRRVFDYKHIHTTCAGPRATTQICRATKVASHENVVVRVQRDGSHLIVAGSSQSLGPEMNTRCSELGHEHVAIAGVHE